MNDITRLSSDELVKLAKPTWSPLDIGSLATLGGINIISTISDPCLYTNEEIADAGFTLLHREIPFFNLRSQVGGTITYDKSSELVMMVRYHALPFPISI